jgi:hypothetical protein
MPCDNFLNCATCHNLKPSLAIIIDNVDQYFKNKNKNFTSKNPHSAVCQILMNGWKLVTLVWCYGYSCNELA